MYITDQESFDAFIERAHSSRLCAIDTEFLREKSYYPQFCLLQVATDTEEVIVDPFYVKDLSPFCSILEDESITKIFHAGRQDLEILLHELHCLPKPLFDTQVAATLLGYSQQVGYGALVSSLCGVNLKKMDSYTDWATRPLSDSQIEYAIDDVRYMPKIYDMMVERLKKSGRLEWLDEDFQAMESPDRYVAEPREVYKHLKRSNSLDIHQLAISREIAAWREDLAQRRNIPRKWILSDEQIVEISRREATNASEVLMVRGVKDHISTQEARTIAELAQKALSLKEDELPVLEKQQRNERNVDGIVDLMVAIVRQRSAESNIATQTLASRSDLTNLARGYFEDSPLMKGWRREIVGNDLRRLMEGELVLSVDNGELIIGGQEA